MKQRDRQTEVRLGVPRKFSSEELIEQLSNLATELGHIPSLTEFNRCAWAASSTTVIRRFGSWSRFVEAADLEFGAREAKKYSKDELIQQVCMLAQELGHTPTATEFGVDPRTASVGTVKNYFGSWNNFLVQAGLKLSKHTYSEAALLEQLMALTDELGRVPAAEEFNRNRGTASKETIYNHFGNWGGFLKKANLRPCGCRKRYSKDILIEQIKMLVEESGRIPLAKDFGDDSRTASISTICVYFGSWGKALKEAGFSVKRSGVR